jgi:hypothetical protein
MGGGVRRAGPRFEGGKCRVPDGPFAESKELAAGYGILDPPSKAAAIEWSIRFGDVVKVKASKAANRDRCRC